MFSKKIRTVGDIYIDSSLKNGQGVRITNEFFSRLIEEFAKQSTLYIRATNEAPFAFKEKQLHSIVAPALSKYTKAFLMEPPVNRRWSSISKEDLEDSHGWIDYWCYYRNIVFLIELKHGYLSSISGQVTQNVKDSWEIAIKQLYVIKEAAKVHAENSNGAFRVALSILPIYEVSNSENPKTINQTDILLNIQNKIEKELKPAPNWIGLWVLHKDLVGPYKYLNSVEYYPGVIFTANISEIHTQSSRK